MHALNDLLQRWFAKPRLDSRQASRLASWQALPANATSVSFKDARCVVLDVETTGLNLATDTLISIGAVAIVNGRISLGDTFSVILQQRNSSRKENILVHGISGSEQREGVTPADALLSFLEYLGKAPLVAFHVAFDETMVRRAMRQHLGLSFRHPWLDLAYVMPALCPDLMHSHRSLDDWSRHFDIRNENRHNALADALVTAQLLLIAVSRLQKEGQASYKDLRSLERGYRHEIGRAHV